MKINVKYLWCVISIIVLTLPNIDIPMLYSFNNIANYIKMITIVLDILLFVLSRKKMSNLTQKILVSILIIFLLTIINSNDILYVIKVYAPTIAIVMLIDFAMQKYKDRFLGFISNYNLILLILNLFVVIYSIHFKTINYTQYDTFLLGFDNRFILYIVCPIIGYNYLYQKYKQKKYKRRLILSIIVGLASLIIVWSAAAMFTMLLMLICYYFFSTADRLKINIHTIALAIFIFSALISIFNIQYYFAYIIENILHKSLDLSYRTLIWNKALLLLKLKPVHYLIGYGYFNTAYTLTIDKLHIGLIHCHNLIVNNLFFGGIIWSFFYYIMLYNVSEKINKSNRYIKTCNMCIYWGILILMIFDVYEFYAIYYMILMLLYLTSEEDNLLRSREVNE